MSSFLMTKYGFILLVFNSASANASSSLGIELIFVSNQLIISSEVSSVLVLEIKFDPKNKINTTECLQCLYVAIVAREKRLVVI